MPDPSSATYYMALGKFTKPVSASVFYLQNGGNTGCSNVLSTWHRVGTQYVLAIFSLSFKNFNLKAFV